MQMITCWVPFLALETQSQQTHDAGTIPFRQVFSITTSCDWNLDCTSNGA